jgi:hypothetical protein
MEVELHCHHANGRDAARSAVLLGRGRGDSRHSATTRAARDVARQMLDRATEGLERFVTTLLDCFRPIELVRAATSTAHVVGALAMRAASRPVAVSIVVSEGADETIVADPAQLARVVACRAPPSRLHGRGHSRGHGARRDARGAARRRDHAPSARFGQARTRRPIRWPTSTGARPTHRDAARRHGRRAGPARASEPSSYSSPSVDGDTASRAACARLAVRARVGELRVSGW